jgi:hypothetical protein
MRRALAGLAIAACATVPAPRPLALPHVRPEDVAIRDREILQAGAPFFPENDPHLLPEVRDALDRPLDVPRFARSLTWFLDGGHVPDARLDGLDSLRPEVARAVAAIHCAARVAAEEWALVLANLGEEDRAFLRETLPRWVARTKPGDREKALAGGEDAAERDALIRCAALWGRREPPWAAWRNLLLVTKELVPALRAQGTLVTRPIVVETPQGPVVIRGTGDDRGEVDAFLLVDFGGDDEYKMPAKPVDRPVRVVIDLDGNDLCLSKAPFSWGAALLGLSLHLDATGDDDYRGGDWSLGCGVAGAGALLDLGGDDRYFGGLGSQGVGVLGSGTLHDLEGDDEYVAGCFCQGFASTGGRGALVDDEGNDSYFAGRDEEDIWRREATYITFAQGSAFGHRFGHVHEEGGERRWKTTGQLPGGVGLLCDASGDDRYHADVFAQGSAYWYSLGVLVDGGGNDRYRATWYGQGVGAHAAVGCLVDRGGDDRYCSRNTSQGCGHDFSAGILLDEAGDDRYSGSSLCQGAGNALCGLGVLADRSGSDVYRCGSRCWGFGAEEPRRPDAAPWGFLLDEGGGRDRFEGGPAGRAAGEWHQGARGHGVDR